MTAPKTVKSRGPRIAHGLGAAVGAFIVATVGLSLGITLMGGEQLAGSDLSLDQMGMFELTGAAAVGIASAVMSLIMGLVGIITTAVATIIGLAVGAAGVAGAVIVGVGVLTGPVLLIAAIAIAVRRRFFPDVI